MVNYDKSDVVRVPFAYSRANISVKQSQIPRAEECMQWRHLKCVASHLVPYEPTRKIGMLIGTDCSKALRPVEVIAGNENEPYAQKTALGWAVVGATSGKQCRRSSEDFSRINSGGASYWASRALPDI